MNKYFRKLREVQDLYRMRKDVRNGVPVKFDFRGKQYHVNSDRSAVYHIRNSTEKIARMTDLVPQDAEVIFDVGGNCGLFSSFAHQVAPKARIYCFEPSPKLVPIIKSNIKTDLLEIHEVAVGQCEETLDFYVNPDSEQTNSLNREAVELFAKPGSIDVHRVDCITLDDFCTRKGIEKIDVLKVDVQGFEGSVFRGCKRMMSTVDLLFVESTWMDIESIVEFLPFAKHYGFKFACVLNPVYMGADILLSRDEITSTEIKLKFEINDELFASKWL